MEKGNYNNKKDSPMHQQLIIKENYLTSISANGSHTQMYENPNSPKLFTQLILRDKQKSYIYNILVLSTFNINMAHFCFPYLVNRCGLGYSLLILLICGIFSYMVLNSLIRYIAHARTSQSNYACIIEENFGSFCAGFLEVAIIIWYGMILLVSLRTLKHLLDFILINELGYSLNTFRFLYPVVIFVVLIIWNKMESPKLMDFNLYFSLFVNFLSICIYIMICVHKSLTMQHSGWNIGELFIVNSQEMYDCFSVFSFGMNTIIIFFWVNNKLADSAVNKHSNMLKMSALNVLSYYIIFMFATYFPRDMVDFSTKFLIHPNYKTDSKYSDTNSLIYYMNLSGVVLNIIHQFVMLNFYFIVIKNLIIRPKVSIWIRKKNYYLTCPLYFIGIIALSFLKINPYYLIVINNGTVGFLINYFIPTMLYIKLSTSNFFSFPILFRIFLTFVLSILCITSFYKNIYLYY